MPLVQDEPLPCDPQAIVALVRKGDIEALETLSRCYGERMLQVGRRRCRDEAAAQDAVQDAFLAAGENLQRFRGEGSLEGWLVRMVSNACSRMRRGQKNNPRLHVDAQDADLRYDLGPEQQALRGEILEAVGAAMVQLDPRDRALVMLADAEGWKAPEIAEATGMTPGAVRTRLSRARRTLRDHLSPLREILEGD